MSECCACGKQVGTNNSLPALGSGRICLGCDEEIIRKPVDSFPHANVKGATGKPKRNRYETEALMMKRAVLQYLMASEVQDTSEALQVLRYLVRVDQEFPDVRPHLIHNVYGRYAEDLLPPSRAADQLEFHEDGKRIFKDPPC